MTVRFRGREHPPVFVATTDLFLLTLTFQWFAQCFLKLGSDRSQRTWSSVGWLVDEAVQDCGGWAALGSRHLSSRVNGVTIQLLIGGGGSQLWCDLIYLVLGGQDRV